MRNQEEIGKALTWVQRANANAEADAVHLGAKCKSLYEYEKVEAFVSSDPEGAAEWFIKWQKAHHLAWALENVQAFIEWLLEKDTEAAKAFGYKVDLAAYSERINDPEFLAELIRKEKEKDQQQADEEDE